jgi:hypothetical protein
VVAAVVRLRKGNRRISPQRAQRSTEEAEKDKKEQKRKKDLTAEDAEKAQREEGIYHRDAEVGAQRSRRVRRKLCTGPALLDPLSARFQI